MTGPLFIGSEIYRSSTYGRRHPLAIPRVSTVIDLCRSLGWLPDERYIDSPIATPRQLARFHDPNYIRAVQTAERDGQVSDEVRKRHNLGTIEAPVYGEMFRRPATAAGASIHAAERLRTPGIVYSPAGGTHHGRRDRASGFCFFNDPVLGLLTWLDQGLEAVLYIDIDAHHCDGVQDAFENDARVTTVSVHENGRWPNTGHAADRANGTAYNFPVPRDFNDDELVFLLHEAILPLAESLKPQAIMIQGGADALAEDPLSKLSLSNRAHWQVIEALMPIAPRLIVTGGGGYNPWSVARCWTGVWAILNGLEIPGRLPIPAETLLREISWNRSAGRNPPDHWFTTLKDDPRLGPIRDEVRALVTARL